jgi:dihydroorotase
VCHISCKESVELIRQAKADGINITCETAPHYLLLDENDLIDDGRFKMNPPLRSAEDRAALIEGIKDGTIDIIATDHAPHSAEEKSKGLAGSAFGIVGLETAFPVLYTYLVKTGVISLVRLIDLICINPRKRFGIIRDKGFSVWKLDKEYTVDPRAFLSKGKSTPFEGKKVFGKCVLTVTDGEVAYKDI